MYQPLHLDSFLRLLIAHFGKVIEDGERLSTLYTDQNYLAALIEAIDSGDTRRLEDSRQQHRQYEALYALQMNQAREWAEQLGRFDLDVERHVDDFLVATLPVQDLLHDLNDEPRRVERLNRLINHGDAAALLRADLQSHIDIEGMTRAIFELLGRLEEQYNLIGDLITDAEIEELLPLTPPPEAEPAAKGAQVISLHDFAARKRFNTDLPAAPAVIEEFKKLK